MAHTIISLPFGIYFSNPVLIFILAFVFHLIADSIYHWNFDPQDRSWTTYSFILLEVVSGVVLARLLVGPAFWSIPIWAAIAGGNTPDVLHMIWYYMPPEQRARLPRWVKRYFWIHETIQFETENIIAGLIPQIIAVGAALLYIFASR